MKNISRKWFGWWALSLVFFPQVAFALQPVSAFVQGARTNNPQRLAAKATSEQRTAEQKATSSQLLPSLTLQGSYTRNQYERYFIFPGSLERLPLLPYNQLDAAVTLTVPIINVGAWEQNATSKAVSDLAQANEAAVSQDLERQVIQAYYQVLGSAAVRDAAKTNLKIAQENEQLVRQRREAGVVTELDVERSRAEVAHAEQDVASAELAEELAMRRLATLSGIEPEGVSAFPSDDLHEEAPLSAWTDSARSAPVNQAARASTEVAKHRAKASKSVWYPVVTGTAQERFTNATALVGHEAYYMLQLSALWKFEFANLHEPEAKAAHARATEANQTLQQRSTADAIFMAWSQVRTGIEKAKSARAQTESARRALEIAREQYAQGAVTQLEVLAAQRSAFSADVARIQVDTDLGYARAALRVLAGRDVTALEH